MNSVIERGVTNWIEVEDKLPKAETLVRFQAQFLTGLAECLGFKFQDDPDCPLWADISTRISKKDMPLLVSSVINWRYEEDHQGLSTTYRLMDEAA